MLSRRSIICGCICSAVFLNSRPAEAAPKYCSLSANFDVTTFRRYSRSGDQRLDRSLIAELRKVNRVLGIRPGYQYIDDSESPNAFAHTSTIIVNTKGSIFFGLNLFRSELNSRYGGAAIAGIAAHEGAHIMQFFSDFIGELQQRQTARDMELHADFLAGYFFAASNRTKRSLDSFGKSLFDKGDYDFNNEGHHGTPDQRLEAMNLGYNSYSQTNGLNEAVRRGIEYVTSI